MKKINILLIFLLNVSGVIAQNWVSFSTSNSDIPFDKIHSMDISPSGNIWIGNDIEIDPNKTLEIFFLGNSFIGANDLPSIVNELALAANLPCHIETHAPGGQFSTDHCLNPFVYETINSRNWDYIVIQDNQGAFVNSPPYVSSTYIDANTQLYDSIKANNICTSVIWFAGWAAEGGYPTYFPGDNTQSCIERILANVVFMNSPMDEVVAPIGEGWIRSLNEQASIDLYSSDGVHPSMEGSYLSASVLFSLMFKYNPVNLNYTGGINTTDATYLRQTGYEVVTDYNNQTDYNILSITPEIVYENTQFNTTESYINYQWIYDLSILSGETYENLDYINPGTYAVFVIDNDDCQLRSFDQEFGPLTTAAYSYIENNGTVEFTNLSEHATIWEWDFGDGNYSTDENPVHTYISSGSYTVSLSSSGGTGTAIFNDQISISLSINTEGNISGINIYPNPCKDIFQIQNKTDKTIRLIHIYNSNGQIVKTIAKDILPSSNIDINIKDLNSGLYYVSILSDKTNYKSTFIIR